MAKTSPEMIEKINELYYMIGVKSQVARQLGISPATVAKYIDSNYIPKQVKFEDIPLPEDLSIEIFQQEWVDILKISDAEMAAINEFRKELN